MLRVGDLEMDTIRRTVKCDGRAIELKLRGTAYKVTVARTGPHRFRVAIAGGAEERVVDADLDRIDDYASRMTVRGRTHRLITATHGPVHLVEVDGRAREVGQGPVREPAIVAPGGSRWRR